MIDTHAHIYLPALKENLAEILKRAEEVGVKKILMPGIEEISWKQMIDIRNLTSVKLYPMFGIHPCDVQKGIMNYESLLFSYCEKPECIGVGETGLDYYWSKELITEQKESLRIHCKVAKALNKPIVLHNRESTEDLLELIKAEQDGSLTGVWHCFNGTVEQGKQAIDLGFHLGIGGVVTFKNGGVDKTVAQLPLEKLILETDTPYLAPTPHRGKQNEPSFISLVAKKLADIFELSTEEIDRITTENANQLFKLSSF